jgi:hypothetical protein
MSGRAQVLYARDVHGAWRPRRRPGTAIGYQPLDTPVTIGASAAAQRSGSPSVSKPARNGR